jgi:putative DNA primase/helicase
MNNYTQNHVKESAKAYTERGWVVIPLAGKVPSVKEWQHLTVQQARDSLDRWFADGANVGIVTGTSSGIFVVDIDPKNGGEDSWSRLIAAHGIPETATVVTGSGGRHFYFKMPQHMTIRNSSGKLGAGIDVRGEGGQVVAPPSVHPETHRAYEWQSQDVADAPAWLLSMLSNEVVEKGTRNNTLTKIAGRYRRDGMSEEQLVVALLTDNKRVCVPPLPEEEVRKIAKSVARYPTQRDDDSQFHDVGNARRLMARYGDTILYVPEFGWMHWNEQKWERVPDEYLMKLAQDAITGMLDEAAEAQRSGHVDKATALARWFTASSNASRINNMVEIAKSMALTSSDRFNEYPNLLNVANGVVDLTTGELRPKSSEMRMSQLTDINYIPSARAPKWLEFLRWAFKGDEELMAFMQRAVGYSLSGSTREQAMFFMFGPPRSGKTTITRVLETLLGDYAGRVNIRSLMLDGNSGAPGNGIAQLAGTRLVFTSETSAGRRIDEGLIKDLTGEDTITARFMFKEPFKFKPQFKLWMYGNFRPVARSDDGGFWRRMRVIPCEAQIPEEQVNPNLYDELADELEGILAWAVRGAVAWYESGLQAPKRVKEATMAYQSESDFVAQFAEECVVEMRGAKIPTKTLYQAFRAWCKSNDIRASGSQRAITEQLKTILSNPPQTTSHGVIYLNGFYLSEEAQELIKEPPHS